MSASNRSRFVPADPDPGAKHINICVTNQGCYSHPKVRGDGVFFAFPVSLTRTFMEQENKSSQEMNKWWWKVALETSEHIKVTTNEQRVSLALV